VALSIPFTFIYLKSKWAKNDDYMGLAFNIKVEYESKIHSGYFWGQQFWFDNGDGGYFGVQSDGDINNLKTKIAIFSIWKATGAERSTFDGSTAEPFDHEGSGFSCKIPFNWEEGIEYKLQIKKITMRGSLINAWHASITDLSTKLCFSIGTIQIPRTWNNLKPDANFFIEYFRPLSSYEVIPYTIINYSSPLMLGQTSFLPEKHVIEPNEECSSVCTVTERDRFNFAFYTGIKT
jgi:hypothetical protein